MNSRKKKKRKGAISSIELYYRSLLKRKYNIIITNLIGYYIGEKDITMFLGDAMKGIRKSQEDFFRMLEKEKEKKKQRIENKRERKKLKL